MDKAEMFDGLIAQRLSLCNQLDDLDQDQWNHPSLCDGWRVRDVLAHLVTLQAVPTRRFVVGVFGMKGFHRRTDQFAKEYGEREPDSLVEQYRGLASSRKTPPMLGPISPLTDVVVHALDIQRPLGLEPIHTDDAARAVLEALCGGLPGFTSKKRLRGLRFESTDLDWSLGSGPIVRGPAADLLLAVMGRARTSYQLEGDGVAVLLANGAP